VTRNKKNLREETQQSRGLHYTLVRRCAGHVTRMEKMKKTYILAVRI
jgi:hypothetical protein